MHFFDDFAVKLCLVAIFALMAVSLFLFARHQARAHDRGWDNMLSLWAIGLILLCFVGLILLAIQQGVLTSVVWLAVVVAVAFVWLIKVFCDQPLGDFS